MRRVRARSMTDAELLHAAVGLIVGVLLHDRPPELSTRDQLILREFQAREARSGALACVCEDCTLDWVDPWG